MNDEPHSLHADPEAREGNGHHVRYDPRCRESVRRAAQRIQRELDLPYFPTVASEVSGGWRRWIPWMRKTA
ncbi:MAG: hypothetical protein ACPGU1_05815 [Myxococcota bacterium]